jgi:hypothetical protein
VYGFVIKSFKVFGKLICRINLVNPVSIEADVDAGLLSLLRICLPTEALRAY